VGELVALAGIYRRLVGARIRGDWQYRASFVLFLLSQTVVAGIDFAVILVLFGRIDALTGWTLEEVALLYGVSGTAFGLGDVFISQVETASARIKAGTFDQLLIRPVPALLQLSGVEFALRRLGRLVQPLIVLIVSLRLVHVDWTLASVALVAAAVASGTAIYGALWVITSSISFWAVDSQEVASAFTYGGFTLSQYPVDVFGAWLRRLVTFAVPIAFVAYLPATELLDKPVALDLPRWIGWSSPAVAVAMVLLARAVWTTAIRHHRSTGS
jgi:ABC-2 type transport system permease protein